MAIFNYTLPSGSTFQLTAPTGTTQAQADAIFYSQVAAGSLVGYVPGQTLSSGITNLTKFQLSRLDRGTAGVDDIALLSSISGLPIISLANGSTTFPSSLGTALTNPVNAGNIIGIVSDGTGYNNGSNLNAPGIGPLTSAQVQAVQAQIKNFVGQPTNAIITPGTFNSTANNSSGGSAASNGGVGLGNGIPISFPNSATNTTGENNAIGSTYPGGLGQYGFDASQLEQAGYLKPGISNFITYGYESITGPTTFPINSPIQYYTVTGVPGTTFYWQSVGGWYKAPTDFRWCAFMDQYAIWVGPPEEVTTHSYIFNLTFPTTGTYTFNLSTDNEGSVSVNGVGTFYWGDFYTVGTVTKTINAGIYQVVLTVTNNEGPAGIALQILNPDSSELWNTLNAISPSLNPNGFTQGGPFTFDGNGTFPPIPAGYDKVGTYQYYGIFSTGQAFRWTNYITYDGPIGPNYIERTPGNFIQVLGAPGVWTGKDGINSLNTLLNNPLVQNIAQTTLMQNAYDSLSATGVINPPKSQPSISQGQVYTQSGLQELSALSLDINAALSFPGITRSAFSTLPVVALMSNPVSVTSTLMNGAINNLNSGAYSSTIDSTNAVTKVVTGTTAALISTASKFGTLAVNSYLNQTLGSNPVSKLISSSLNSTINKVTNQIVNSASNTLTGLINGTTSTDQIATLAKSSDWASGLADPSTAFNNLGDGLTNAVNNGIDNVTNYIDNVSTNIGNTLDNITSGNFSLDPASLVSGPGLGLAEKALGIKGTDAKNLNTAIQIGTAIFSGGTSLFTNPSVINSITGLLGGGGALSSLSSLGSIPGVGAVLGAFGGGGGLSGQTKQAAGFSNTVNRATVDVAVAKILGSNKIPTPIYEYPSIKSQAAATNITQAQNVLSGLQGQATSAISSAVNTASADISSAVSDFFG